MARFAILITYTEILGNEPEASHLELILKKYKRSEVLFLLARLNCLLGTWKNSPDFGMDEALTRVFLQAHLHRVESIRMNADRRVVFSRMGLLYLMKQACIMCPENGMVPSTDEARSDVGMACLIANDLMLLSPVKGSGDILAKLANIFPFSDYVSHDHYPLEIARAQTIFGEVSKSLSLKARPDFIDVEAMFCASMGLSHLSFSQLVFGCSTKFLNLEVGDALSPDRLVLRTTFFRNSVVPEKTVRTFFEKIGISEQELADKVKDSARPGDDFTIFQAFPLVQFVDGAYMCLDPGFLVEKAGRGLYWTMFGELSDKDRAGLATFWGAVFEEYANKILEEHYSAGGRFISDPGFSDGTPAFDACLIEGRRFIAFEHKSSTLRANSKYAGDIEALKKDLDSKFVVGEGSHPKGVEQLIRNIARFLAGDTVDGVSQSEMGTVYPCLVCLDDSVRVPFLSLYFKNRFHAGFPRKQFRQAVTPLYTLAISDVENLLGYLCEIPLSDILESYYSKNREMLSALSSSDVPLLKTATPGPNNVTESFKSFGRKMERDLFAHDDRPDLE